MGINKYHVLLGGEEMDNKDELFLPCSVVGEDTGEYIVDAEVKKKRSKLIADAFNIAGVSGKVRLEALRTLLNEYGITTIGKRVDGCLKVLDVKKEITDYLDQ